MFARVPRMRPPRASARCMPACMSGSASVGEAWRSCAHAPPAVAGSPADVAVVGEALWLPGSLVLSEGPLGFRHGLVAAAI